MNIHRTREHFYVAVAFTLTLSLLLIACGGAAPEQPAARARLIIYTAKEPEEVAEFIPIAEASLPDVSLEVLRLSTGDLTARLLAEKERPIADVIWGVAATSMMILDNEGMLEPYAPQGLEGIEPKFRSPNESPTWVGVDAYINAICYNTQRAQELGLPMPETWEDLLDPAFEGHVVMPNPASSGTGYMFVSGALQAMGEDQGWTYLAGLDRNMVMYTKSGSRPCKMAAAGEYAVGLSFAFVGYTQKEQGAPLEVIIPRGTGWEMEANGLMKGTEEPEAARRFLDWAISDEAMALYAKYFGVLAKVGYPSEAEGFPEDVVQRLWDVDPGWSSANREAVLEEWTSRFAVKAEE